jgi:acetyl esterase/lipase
MTVPISVDRAAAPRATGPAGGVVTEKTSFPSGRERCAAWVTLPEGPPPHPAVVLVHGGGAVHDMKLQDAAFAWRDDKGKIRIHQAVNLTGAGAPCWGP